MCPRLDHTGRCYAWPIVEFGAPKEEAGFAEDVGDGLEDEAMEEEKVYPRGCPRLKEALLVVNERLICFQRFRPALLCGRNFVRVK